MIFRAATLILAVTGAPAMAQLTMTCTERSETPTGILSYEGYFKAQGIKATPWQHSTGLIVNAASTVATPGTLDVRYTQPRLKFVYKQGGAIDFVELQVPFSRRQQVASPRLKLIRNGKPGFDLPLGTSQVYALREGQSLTVEIPAAEVAKLDGTLSFAVVTGTQELARLGFVIDRRAAEAKLSTLATAAQTRFLRQPMVEGKLPTALPLGANGCKAMPR